jgi:hypothetical protein
MERGICKLCPIDKDLQDSHFLGKIVYQKLSEPSLKNPTPVMITRDTAKQSPIQIRDHVFCCLSCSANCHVRDPNILATSWISAPLRMYHTAQVCVLPIRTNSVTCFVVLWQFYKC